MYSVEWALPKCGPKKYICVKNTNGKQWYIPKDAIKVGLELYQPTSLKGKLLKICLRVKPLRVILAKYMPGISVQKRTLLPEIQKSIEVLLGEKLEYSFYMGDASIPQNRKLVVQIYRGKMILAYAKLTKEECVKQIFKHEQEILYKLAEASVENVPQVLTAFSKGEIVGFVQSTKKECGFHTLHTYGTIQDEFLKNMQKPFKHQALLKDLPCIRSFNELNNYMMRLPFEHQKILKGALHYIEMLAPHTKMEVSLAHRDFTPWNSFFQQDTFFAFDFEYAEWEYPIYYDALHYCIQPLIVSDKRFKMADVLSALESAKLCKKKMNQFQKLQISIYCLDQILFQAERNCSFFQEKTFEKYSEILEGTVN